MIPRARSRVPVWSGAGGTERATDLNLAAESGMRIRADARSNRSRGFQQQERCGESVAISDVAPVRCLVVIGRP